VSGDLVRRPANVLASADVMGAEQFDNVYRMAKALAASGMFKDVTQAEQAFGRILLGADLGLTPTQALMSIDVVKGNVQVRAVRLAAWVRQHPDYDYAIVAHDEAHCVIDFYYKGGMTLPILTEYRQSTLRAMEVCPRRTRFALELDEDLTTGWTEGSADLGTVFHAFVVDYMKTLRRPEFRPAKQMPTEEAVNVAREVYAACRSSSTPTITTALMGMASGSRASSSGT
jgi:hypothetical protein